MFFEAFVTEVLFDAAGRARFALGDVAIADEEGGAGAAGGVEQDLGHERFEEHRSPVAALRGGRRCASSPPRKPARRSAHGRDEWRASWAARRARSTSSARTPTSTSRRSST